MKIETFLNRRPRWEELEALIARARRGRLRDVETRELERFGVLYRHVASDLAIARRDFPDETVTLYLNGLCARAHPLLVRGRPTQLRDIVGFYRRTVPQLFRRALPYFALSLGITFIAAVAGWIAVEARPDLRASLVPTSLFDLLARGDIAAIPDPVGGSWTIIANNIVVTLICLAGGMAVGIPTVFFLLQNGWMLGTLGAAVHDGGYSAAFWPDIAPHGIVEMSVIIIAGSCGLMIGDAVLRPGRRARGDYVARVAGDAVRLTTGCATLLVICGILEGFVSPSTLPAPLKVGIGVVYATLVYSWLTLGGRPSRRRPARARVPATSRDEALAAET